MSPPRPTSAVSCAGVRGIVEEPSCKPEGPNDTAVPESVTADPPIDTLWPSSPNAVGFAVKVWPATVNTDCKRAVCCAGVSGIVEEPSCKPEGPSEIIVPESVSAGPSIDTLWPSTANAVGFAVKVWPAIEKTDLSSGLLKVTVLPFMMSAPLSEGIVYVVPDIVAAPPPALMMTPFASMIDLRVACSDSVPVGKGYVLPSITTDAEPAEIVWPEIIPWLPGAHPLLSGLEESR